MTWILLYIPQKEVYITNGKLEGNGELKHGWSDEQVQQAAENIRERLPELGEAIRGGGIIDRIKEFLPDPIKEAL